jgi:ribonuclease P protein component
MQAAPGPPASQSFPKQRRLLRSRDFRDVYDTGTKVVGRSFVAFCRYYPAADGPRIGFTTPRTLGKAVRRNRMRRRVREVFRRRWTQLSAGWRIVVNLRAAALDAPLTQIVEDVDKVLARCKP